MEKRRPVLFQKRKKERGRECDRLSIVRRAKGQDAGRERKKREEAVSGHALCYAVRAGGKERPKKRGKPDLSKNTPPVGVRPRSLSGVQRSGGEKGREKGGGKGEASRSVLAGPGSILAFPLARRNRGKKKEGEENKSEAETVSAFYPSHREGEKGEGRREKGVLRGHLATHYPVYAGRRHWERGERGKRKKSKGRARHHHIHQRETTRVAIHPSESGGKKKKRGKKKGRGRGGRWTEVFVCYKNDFLV